MAKISAAEYEALPESLKSEFIADGDGFGLKREDVEGLKQSKEQILAEKKRLAAEFEAAKKRLEEIDKKTAEGEEEKLKAAGEFKALEEKLRAKLAETESAAQQAQAELLATIKRERLHNELTQRGVLPDRVKYALTELDSRIDIERSEAGFAIKVKDGIGDAKEFDQAVEQLKQKAPFLFGATTTAGSGASGSGQKQDNGAKTWTRAQWDAATPMERVEFSKGNGKLSD